jgi:hypothetical protein
MKAVSFQISLSLWLLSPMASKVVAEMTNLMVAPAASKHIVGSSSTMTPDDWQELRNARQAALKENPELVAKAQELSAKMRAFQEKLDAAMLKSDPKLAPVLAKFEGGHNVTQNPASLQKTPQAGPPP